MELKSLKSKGKIPNKNETTKATRNDDSRFPSKACCSLTFHFAFARSILSIVMPIMKIMIELWEWGVDVSRLKGTFAEVNSCPKSQNSRNQRKYPLPQILALRPQIRCLCEPDGNKSGGDSCRNKKAKRGAEENLPAQFAHETLIEHCIVFWVLGCCS